MQLSSLESDKRKLIYSLSNPWKSAKINEQIFYVLLKPSKYQFFRDWAGCRSVRYRLSDLSKLSCTDLVNTFFFKTLFFKTFKKRVIFCSLRARGVNSILITILRFWPSSFKEERTFCLTEKWSFVCLIWCNNLSDLGLLFTKKKSKLSLSWERWCQKPKLYSTMYRFRTVGISRFQFWLILQIYKNAI